MSSIDPWRTCTERQREVLLAAAFAAIEHGLSAATPAPVEVPADDPVLGAAGANFVSLYRAGELRGCIGTLTAKRPLIEDVAHNAYAAAFSDPRFPRLTRRELECLELHVTLLAPPEPLHFDCAAALIAQLRPHQDGLVLEEGGRRATFLPAVWQTLPEPELFLRQLKLKAGLPADYWSETLRIARYAARSFQGRYGDRGANGRAVVL